MQGLGLRRMKFWRRMQAVLFLAGLFLMLGVMPVLAAPIQQEVDPGGGLPDFATTAMIGAVPVMFVVLGAVQWLKQLKDRDGKQAIKGNSLLYASMGLGVVFGTIYMMTQSRPPVGSDWYVHFLYWVGAMVYGLALGLLASGIYDALSPKTTDTVG